MEHEKQVEPKESTEVVVSNNLASEQTAAKSPKKLAIIFGGVLVLIAVGAVLYFNRVVTKDTVSTTESPIKSFAECVAAGNPIMESNPEQCSANGETFINKETATKETPTKDTDVVADETADDAVCTDGQTQFTDEDFGAKYCYPSE